MFCVFFAEFLKIIVPGVGLWHYVPAPWVGVSHFSCAQGVGDSHFQKIPSELPGGRMVRLGID